MKLRREGKLPNTRGGKSFCPLPLVFGNRQLLPPALIGQQARSQCMKGRARVGIGGPACVLSCVLFGLTLSLPSPPASGLPLLSFLFILFRVWLLSWERYRNVLDSGRY